jgi:hypothetical protein
MINRRPCEADYFLECALHDGLADDSITACWCAINILKIKQVSAVYLRTWLLVVILYMIKLNFKVRVNSLNHALGARHSRRGISRTIVRKLLYDDRIHKFFA